MSFKPLSAKLPERVKIDRLTHLLHDVLNIVLSVVLDKPYSNIGVHRKELTDKQYQLIEHLIHLWTDRAVPQYIRFRIRKDIHIVIEPRFRTLTARDVEPGLKIYQYRTKVYTGISFTVMENSCVGGPIPPVEEKSSYYTRIYFIKNCRNIFYSVTRNLYRGPTDVPVDNFRYRDANWKRNISIVSMDILKQSVLRSNSLLHETYKTAPNLRNRINKFRTHAQNISLSIRKHDKGASFAIINYAARAESAIKEVAKTDRKDV